MNTKARWFAPVALVIATSATGCAHHTNNLDERLSAIEGRLTTIEQTAGEARDASMRAERRAEEAAREAQAASRRADEAARTAEAVFRKNTSK